MLTYVFIFIALVVVISVIIWFVVAGSQNKARKVAKQMIADGNITDTARVERVLSILNEQSDTESKHLWHKLTELKESKG